jgi:hypothetical protein
MLMCRERLVGRSAFVILIADLLSSHIGVGVVWTKPSWERIDCKYFETLPQEMAAMNSASVELVAVSD